MEIVAAESTNLFIGSEASPRQVVRVILRGTEPTAASRLAFASRAPPAGPRSRSRSGRSGRARKRGSRSGSSSTGAAAAGELLDAEVVVDGEGDPGRRPFQFTVVEPGWRMFMIAHFHYDPVWWNTQAAYTETWGTAIQYRAPFQEPGLALVKAHLDMARRDPDYKFVLAELDYLKPYWDVYPEDRDYIRQLLAEDRLEFVGGTYNEPNTNLTSAESTIRNAIYGIGYQRDVLGGRAGDRLAARCLRSRPAVSRDHGRRRGYLELVGPRAVPRVGTALGPRTRPRADSPSWRRARRRGCSSRRSSTGSRRAVARC